MQSRPAAARRLDVRQGRPRTVLRHDGAVKLALLSDLHANLRAFDACLAHARAAGATRFALLGDLVGYGPEPVQLLDRVMALAQDGAIVLRGNHDDAARQPPATRDTAEAVSSAWTHAQLGPAHLAFLAGLPLTATADDALLVHASAHQPQQWEYVDRPAMARRCLEAAEEQWGLHRVFCGHVHEQLLYYRGADGKPMAFSPVAGVPVPLAAHRSWLALVGSVGQPRDGDPRAMYALLDTAQARLGFHRIAYDHVGAAAAVRAAGLPEGFAQRLERGR
jgi:diadenosine tetraphosphatase ApaH/serine/threonine PP2A family protein phosphatase